MHLLTKIGRSNSSIRYSLDHLCVQIKGMKRYKVIDSIIHELHSEEIHELVGLTMHKERPVSRAFHLIEEANNLGRWRSSDFLSFFEVKVIKVERDSYSFDYKVALIKPQDRLPIFEYLLTQQDYSVEQIVWDEHKYVYALRRVALSMQQYLQHDDSWKDSLRMSMEHLKSLDADAKAEYDTHMSPLLDAMGKHHKLWADYSTAYERAFIDKDFVDEPESDDILERIRARRRRESRYKNQRHSSEIPTTSVSSVPEGKKSIIYRVNERHLVTPFQQIESLDGRWNPCNRVNLAQFEEKAVEGMTALDKKIADLMAKHPEDSPLKQGDPALLEMLKGQECLYEANQPAQKVSIQSTTIGIRVMKMEFEDRVLRSTVWGLSIGFNKPISLVEGQTTYVYKPCDGVRELCVIPSQLVSALVQLKHLEPLPLEASDCIVQLVKELSDLQVEADIPPSRPTAHLVQKIEASNYMVVQFNPKNEGFQCRILARPSMDGQEVFAPSKGPEVCLQLHQHQVVLIKRQMKAERDLINTLKKRIKKLDGYNMDDSNFFLPSNEACLGMLDTLHKSKQKVVIEWPRGGVIGRPIQVKASDVSIKTKSLRQWFEVQVSLKVNDEVLPLEEMIELIRSQSSKEYIQVDDSKFLSITHELREHLVSLDAMLQNKGSAKIVSSFSAPVLKHYEETGMHLSKCTRLRQMLSRIKEASDIVPVVPGDLHATLRDYQQTGFEWLSRLYQWRAGACLADDMGLGKTLQTITLLLSQAEQGPSLIVVPSSVIYNWRDEIQKFAPSLRVSLLNKTTQRDKMIDKAEKGEVVITSYGLVHTNSQSVSEKKWNIVVLDEAHVIKNRSSKTSQAVKQIEADFTLLLTGTPVQNHLAEIWNLFDIAVPSLLGSYKHFVSTYVQGAEKNENEAKHQRLKTMLQPFILRRTKGEVAKELPLKTEINIHVELSDKERVLYEAVRTHALETLDSGSISMVTALTEINKLRQLSCNPRLIHPQSKVESSKMMRFMEVVDRLQANNHIALVFSQFTRHLSLVKEQLEQVGVSYLYLDGSQSTRQRAQLVEEFNKGETRIFLISLKAGGVGLNLTTADFVIHLDPWWNPAIESQATDRAYRIGQDKPVTVYRMVSTNTIEEQILEMHEEKRSMADTLLEGSSMATQLTPQEMLRLLTPK